MKRYGYLLFLVCIVCLINSCRKEDGCATAYCGRWDTLADTGYYSCGTVVDNYIYTMWTPKEIRKMTRNADSFNYGNAKKIRVCGWWFKPHETIFLCDDNLTSLNPFTDACFPTESCEGWLKCDFRNNIDLMPNFNSTDIHKKCYVSGEIRLDYPPEKVRCQNITPTLVVTNLFFEE